VNNRIDKNIRSSSTHLFQPDFEATPAASLGPICSTAPGLEAPKAPGLLPPGHGLQLEFRRLALDHKHRPDPVLLQVPDPEKQVPGKTNNILIEYCKYT
jgi:hypothetical protein